MIITFNLDQSIIGWEGKDIVANYNHIMILLIICIIYYIDQSIIGWEGKDIVANSSEIVYEGKLKVRHPK